MNSDLNPAQNVSPTDNPQAAQNSQVGASDATQFQQSAGADVLSQNKTLQVVTTGTPNAAPVAVAVNNMGWLFAVVIVLAIVAAVAAYRMPSKSDKAKATADVPKEPVIAVKPAKKPAGKKKQPRSKRSK